MSNDHLSAMMAPLKEKYIAGLQERRQELCDFILHCKNEAVPKEKCTTMHRRAHGLATQGKTFGFTQVVDAALALQQQLEREGEIAFIEMAESAETLLRAADAVVAGHINEERVPE